MSSDEIIETTLHNVREMNKLILKLDEFLKLEKIINELKHISSFKDDLISALNQEIDYKESWLNEIKKLNDELIEMNFYHIEELKISKLSSNMQQHIL